MTLPASTFMRRMRARTRMLLATSLLAVASLLAPSIQAAPDEEAAAKGPRFANPQIGVRAAGPEGWKMAADKAEQIAWERLVTFWDPESSAEAVLSRRKRTSATVEALQAKVRREFSENTKLTVSGVRAVPASQVQKQASVIVDATEVKRPKPKNPEDPPIPPVTWRIQATYLLAPGYEYLLYVKAQATHWSRVRGALTQLRASVKFDGAEGQAGVPTGAGAYRNQQHGFACKYPEGYTVVVPGRRNHVVQFEGSAPEDIALGVYSISWKKELGADAARLTTYYKDDLAGEVTEKEISLAGKKAIWLRAEARVGGKNQVFFLVLIKRGDVLYRLKGSVIPSAATPGEAAFRSFVDSFVLGIR